MTEPLSREQVLSQVTALSLSSTLMYSTSLGASILLSDATLRAQLAQLSSCHCCGQPIMDQQAFVKCPACDANDSKRLAQVTAERGKLTSDIAFLLNFDAAKQIRQLTQQLAEAQARITALAAR